MATDAGAAPLDDEFEATGDDLPPEELSIEQQARMRGWKPLAEFTGDPARWRDAAEFLQVADGDNRLLRENNRRLERTVQKLQGQVTALGKNSEEQLIALREMRQIAARNDQRGYDRAMQELHEERAAAVRAADDTAFDQVEQRIKELGARPADPPPPPPAAADVPPEVADFIADNPWYQSDPVLNRTMIATYDIVARRHPTWGITQVLEEAKARTIQEYPEKFPEMSREPAPAPRPRSGVRTMQPGANPPRQPRQAAGWDQIPDSDERKMAQGAYERQKRADPGLTAGEFLALYLDPYADVLALRAQRKP